MDWLDYQRHEFGRKLRDLDPEGIVEWSIPRVESVPGLIRHMTQMGHVYLSSGLGDGEMVLAHGEEDYAGGSPETVEEDIRAYLEEIKRANLAIAALPRSKQPERATAGRSGRP